MTGARDRDRFHAGKLALHFFQCGGREDVGQLAADGQYGTAGERPENGPHVEGLARLRLLKWLGDLHVVVEHDAPAAAHGQPSLGKPEPVGNGEVGISHSGLVPQRSGGMHPGGEAAPLPDIVADARETGGLDYRPNVVEHRRGDPARGMRLVLADIQQDVLDATAAELRAAGATLIAERVDVSVGSDVEGLAARARDAFGQVDLLFNNAGVGSGGLIWENTERDWQWVLGVNVWGVIHGLRAFVPSMLAQGTPGHVVNTASVSGLLSAPLMGVYNASKHAVVTMTETLYHDLALVKARIGCSVLCPAFVPTGIHQSERNRPAAMAGEEVTASQVTAREAIAKAVTSGRLTPQQVASMTFEAIRENRFYIITHPKILGSIGLRHQDIIERRNPSDPYTYKPDAAKKGI